MADNYTNPTSSNSHSAIRSSFRKLVKDHINDPSNDLNHQLLYERQPHVKSQDFPGYPVVILKDYSIQDDSETVNGHRVRFSGTVQVNLEADEEHPEHLTDMMDDWTAAVKGNTGVVNMGQVGINLLGFQRNQRADSINVKDEFIFRRETVVNCIVFIDMGGA